MARREFPGRRPPASEPDWLTLGQAAKYLGVAQSTIRKWSDQGRVPAFYTPGGHRRGRPGGAGGGVAGPDPARRDDAGGRRLGDAASSPGTPRRRRDSGRDVQRKGGRAGSGGGDGPGGAGVP